MLVADVLDENGEHIHAYLDCLPVKEQLESKDWNFVASVFDGLHDSGFFNGYEQIFWWSDTGPNHFRTSNTLYYWRQFQQRTGIKMFINFFAPYHGHSMCDGHIGAISKALHKAAGNLQDTLQDWNRQFVEANIAELKFTTVTHHPINRGPKLVKTLKGIKKYLVFTFVTDGSEGSDESVDCRVTCGAPSDRLYFEKMSQEDQDREELAAAAADSQQQKTMENFFSDGLGN